MFLLARTSNGRTRMWNIRSNSVFLILCLVFIKVICCEEDANSAIHSGMSIMLK